MDAEVHWWMYSLIFESAVPIHLFFADRCGETFLPQVEAKGQPKILDLYIFTPQSAW